jgi:tetratricopeptide (TPR) repeat protein
MNTVLAISLVLVAAATAEAGVGRARALIAEKKPAEAAALLDEMLASKPDDPWLLYNRAVAAYASENFAQADDIWQRLAGMQMPDKLRDQVWTQIGNVSFRIAESSIEAQPDAAVARLEQSREAYRVAISQNRKNETARKNLVFVEHQLELLYVKLSRRLVGDGQKESLPDRAIEKLEAALEYQRNATALNPQEMEHHKLETEIQRLIAQRFTEKGTQAERQADRVLEQKPTEQWRREEAQRNLERALADFKQATSYDADNSDASQGEQRVIDKLAGMLAQAGRQEQKAGDQSAKSNPQGAFEQYERAMEHFDAALAVKSEHEDALAGRAEVQAAMEKLHLKQGDRLAKMGEEQLKKNPATAAENLTSALDHFEQALALNPENPEIPPRIEHVEKLLPEALVSMAQQEQQQAHKAEQNSRQQQAVAHLERAEAGYDKATQLSPDNQEAKTGQTEVQEDLERLRKELAQKAEQKAQQQAKKSEKGAQSFQSMLSQMKARVDDEDTNARNNPGTKYEQPRSNGVRNW